MITELTAEQQARFPEFVDKWTKIGLSCERVDPDRVTDIIRRMYGDANVRFPDNVHFCESPFAAIDLMKEKYNTPVQPSDFVFAFHEAEWFSFYDYLYRVCNLEVCSKLNNLFELVEHSGWCLLYDEVVVITDRPSAVKFNDRKQVHCPDGLAIEYPDGRGVAVWNGTMVPAEWILNPDSITPDVFLHWENIEQRRCASEIIGWAKVLDHLKAKTIDIDDDPTIGMLVEATLPLDGDPVERFLIATDPNTGKQVGLPVPPEMKTALEANSWTYGIDMHDFIPDFRV